MSSVVVVRGLCHEFPSGRELFNQLNFSLETRLTALVGPNGIGKTCLARLLAGDLNGSSSGVRGGMPQRCCAELFSAEHNSQVEGSASRRCREHKLRFEMRTKHWVI